MKDSFRHFQLKCMGYIALVLPPLAVILVMLVHGLPAPSSISQTATIADRTDFLLPLCLGALALFSLTYCVKYTYNYILDRVVTACMFGGFLLVAAQKCASPYLTSSQQGLFGVGQSTSNIIHSIGALIGFGAMIVWIMFCFTKSDKIAPQQTSQKRMRNNLYFWLGVGMVSSLVVFAFNFIGFFGEGFPVVFVAEWLMLTFGGVACLIKGGLFLQDKDPDKVAE